MKHLIPIFSLVAIALIGGFTDCKGGNNAGESHADSDSLFDGMCPCCLEDSVVVTEEAAEVVAKAPRPDNPPVVIDSLDKLTVYYPDFSRIDLVCGQRPSQSDKSVIFMAAGAFTGELLKEFKHSNIAGNHVSNGKLERGFKCTRNTGAFTWSAADGPRFLYDSYSSEMAEAAKKGGCGFGQEMMIHDGKIVKYIRPAGNRNEFRALCLINGKVAVADSKGTVAFGDFVNSLKEAGATEALYMDMGTGWNYSWYRDANGDAVKIHATPIKYSTNWVTFYR